MLVYLITNIINGKQYVGQTTRDLQFRINSYKRDIYSKKNNRPILEAMKEFEFDNFKFEILKDDIQTQTELDEIEKYYIEKFNTQIPQGYNFTKGGGGIGSHSLETIEKLSISQRGNRNYMYGKCGNLNAASKKVVELTTDKIYESANIAANELNLNFSHICATARGTRGSTGGYVFRYLDENNNIIFNENFARIKSFKTSKAILQQYKQYVNTICNN